METNNKDQATFLQARSHGETDFPAWLWPWLPPDLYLKLLKPFHSLHQITFILLVVRENYQNLALTLIVLGLNTP